MRGGVKNRCGGTGAGHRASGTGRGRHTIAAAGRRVCVGFAKVPAIYARAEIAHFSRNQKVVIGEDDIRLFVHLFFGKVFKGKVVFLRALCTR